MIVRYLPLRKSHPDPDRIAVTPVVLAIILATAAGYLLELTMPGLANVLVFYPPAALTHPWTVVTYMFLHDPNSLMHIAFNMIALFFFGPRVEARIGARPFTILYFLSGITGAVLSFFLAHGSPIIGASAGVFGVMLAFAHFWPRELIYIWGIIPVPARVLVILTTIITLWSGFGGLGTGVAHFAHLGGYVGAWLYLRWLERGRTSFKRKVKAAPPEATTRAARWKSIDMTTIHEANRDEVNRILDKISAQGIDALTPQERLFLSNFVPMDDRVPPVS